LGLQITAYTDKAGGGRVRGRNDRIEGGKTKSSTWKREDYYLLKNSRNTIRKREKSWSIWEDYGPVKVISKGPRNRTNPRLEKTFALCPRGKHKGKRQCPNGRCGIIRTMWKRLKLK